MGGKTRNIRLFNSFYSIVAKQVARYLLPVFKYLKVESRISDRCSHCTGSLLVSARKVIRYGVNIA